MEVFELYRAVAHYLTGRSGTRSLLAQCVQTVRITDTCGRTNTVVILTQTFCKCADATCATEAHLCTVADFDVD